MLKRIDKYAANELEPGFRVTFQDADDHPFPHSYEGDVVSVSGRALEVRLAEVRAIGPDPATGAEPAPRAGDVVTLDVGDVAACRELPRE